MECDAPDPKQITLYHKIVPLTVRGGNQEMFRVVGFWTVISTFCGHPVTTVAWNAVRRNDRVPGL